MKIFFVVGISHAPSRPGLAASIGSIYPQILWGTLGITLFIKRPGRASIGFAADAQPVTRGINEAAKIRFFVHPPQGVCVKPTLHNPLRAVALSLATTLALTLAACSPRSADQPVASAVAPAQALEMVLAKGQGFTAGPLMAAQTVYVLFDPQCPHCGHLWQASQPLLNRVKFVWIPVSIINAKSTLQGAALLAASNPSELMNAHEASILAGTGGLPSTSEVAPQVKATIEANTALFNALKLESVPFIVARNKQTGQAISNAGAMTPQALAQWLGLDTP